jgi:hypothetical protein
VPLFFLQQPRRTRNGNDAKPNKTKSFSPKNN